MLSQSYAAGKHLACGRVTVYLATPVVQVCCWTCTETNIIIIPASWATRVCYFYVCCLQLYMFIHIFKYKCKPDFLNYIQLSGPAYIDNSDDKISKLHTLCMEVANRTLFLFLLRVCSTDQAGCLYMSHHIFHKWLCQPWNVKWTVKTSTLTPPWLVSTCLFSWFPMAPHWKTPNFQRTTREGC